MLKRLFPDAYPSDAMASADFRRFTERDLRAMKVAEARVVLDRLATTELGAHDLKIPRDEVESWLRTLTSVRLAVAIRLGIRDAAAADELAALPDEDPRSFMVSVYDWLGFAQKPSYRRSRTATGKAARHGEVRTEQGRSGQLPSADRRQTVRAE